MNIFIITVFDSDIEELSVVAATTQEGAAQAILTRLSIYECEEFNELFDFDCLDITVSEQPLIGSVK